MRLEGGLKHQEGRDEGRAGVLLKGRGLSWLLPRGELEREGEVLEGGKRGRDPSFSFSSTCLTVPPLLPTSRCHQVAD